MSRGHADASSTLGDIAVIGGGIGGLTAAHLLARAGARVTVFEASDQLGGLGTFFEYGARSLERFYHCMLPTDTQLLDVLGDLGLDTETYWKESSFAYLANDRLYPLNSPVDLLRFQPLTMTDRLRVGVAGLWGRLCSATGLDEVTCVDWLSRLSGRRAFELFWKPMLEAKFGDRYQQVPALWFWTRLNREKGSGRERKGYLRGGYRRITDRLAAAIHARGGEIHLRTPVQQLGLGEDGRVLIHVDGVEPRSFDRVICTAAAPSVATRLLGATLSHERREALTAIDMQGVVNVLLVLRRKLTDHYWIATVRDDLPFQGIVETTTLIDPEDTGGLHLIYLTRYLHRSDTRFGHTDQEIADACVTALQRLFPDLATADIVDRFTFRAPNVEPIYTLGYLNQKPPAVLVPGRVYLASTLQVYPEVTSWNGVVGLVHEVVHQVVADARMTDVTST